MVQKWRWRKILKTINLSTNLTDTKGVINPLNSALYIKEKNHNEKKTYHYKCCSYL